MNIKLENDHTYLRLYISKLETILVCNILFLIKYTLEKS